MEKKEPNIVYWKEKKSGLVYAYEDYPYWDPEKKQSRSKRKYLGKVDPSTGKIIPKQERKTKKESKENPIPQAAAGKVIEKALGFLQLSMSLTLAKRLLSIILIVAGLTTKRVAELVGLCNKSVQKIEKQLAEGDFENLFHVGHGGRKGKLIDVEEAIVAEINKNNYHSQQQIADMIYEEYGIKVSLPVVSRLLKKKESDG